MFDVGLEPESSGNGARKMLARHNASIMEILELTADLGVAQVLRAQLVRWYGQERLSRGIWRDIEEKWREQLEENVPLMVAESEGTIIFVYGEGLSSSKDAWLQPVSSLAKSGD